MKKIRQQFLVIGLGRFGGAVARTLSELGHEVLAVDENQDQVEDIAPYVTQAVAGDATDEATLRELDAASFDAAIVSIGSRLRESILISVLLKEIGVPMVIAKAQDELHAKILTKVGVDRVIQPERDMGHRLARLLVTPGIVETMELTDDYQVAEVIVPPSWVNKSLMEINVRRKYGMTVIAIRRNGTLVASPGAEIRFEKDDMMLVLGKTAQIDALEHK